jgi:hypothetical protein
VLHSLCCYVKLEALCNICRWRTRLWYLTVEDLLGIGVKYLVEGRESVVLFECLQDNCNTLELSFSMS